MFGPHYLMTGSPEQHQSMTPHYLAAVILVRAEEPRPRLRPVPTSTILQEILSYNYPLTNTNLISRLLPHPVLSLQSSAGKYIEKEKSHDIFLRQREHCNNQIWSYITILAISLRSHHIYLLIKHSLLTMLIIHGPSP